MLMPLLFSASGHQVGVTTVASETENPQVPATPFDRPASMKDATDIQASPVMTVANVAASDIPAVALAAYRRSESLLAESDPQCKLEWTLVAAIGRVESDHGRYGGNTLDDEGVARPGIHGIALDGSRDTATIGDTDGGELDNDAVWDRAVGPMQFIPATWTSVAIDSDNDGVKDPQNIHDAATAAGVYLCAGSDDLSTEEGARAAAFRYNHSDAYVDKVLAIAAQYATGVFTDPPGGFAPVAPPGAAVSAPPSSPAVTSDVAPQRPETKQAQTAPAETANEPQKPKPQKPAPDDTRPAPVEPIKEPEPAPEEPEQPVEPEPFTGTDDEARELCLASGFEPDSEVLQLCIDTLMATGYLPLGELASTPQP